MYDVSKEESIIFQSEVCSSLESGGDFDFFVNWWRGLQI